MYVSPGQSPNISESEFMPRQADYSAEIILLEPIKQQSTTQSEVSVKSPARSAHHQPVSKLRWSPPRHFWRKPFSLNTLIFLWDLLLTSIPCLFLLLAFGALWVDQEPVSSWRGQKIEQVARLAPTLFPIIFAALVGGLMKSYALWCAERGASLGILEQLIGSQTLVAAIERAILIPGLGFLNIIIVLLWALSPVGGQSALRALGRGTSSSSNTSVIYYFNTTGHDHGLFSSEGYMGLRNSFNAAFQATLGSIPRVRGSDIWGNIKIPVLQYMPTYIAGQNKDGWYQFNEGDYHSPYSALNGIVVSGLKDGIETSFIMKSSYFNLTCTEPVLFDATGFHRFGKFRAWAGTLLLRNESELLSELEYGNHGPASGVGYTSYLVDSNYKHTPKTDVEPRYNIIYAYRNDEVLVDSIVAYNCTVGVSHVESEITCIGSNCQVKKLRPSRNAIWSESGWPWPTQLTTVPGFLLLWLGSATSLDSPTSSGWIYGRVSPIEFYLGGSDVPFRDMSEQNHIEHHNVSGLDLAKRLQSLINTGWQLSFQDSATLRKPSNNETALALSTNSSTFFFADGGVGYMTIATEATMTKKQDVFIANKAWLATTIIVSAILLLCGIAGMIFKYRSCAPDILGYVSSMTRENPSFEELPGADKLDGLQRARALRHLKVQIVDVKPWDQDGYIALRNLGRWKR